jgi:hypothetical protein
LDKISEDADEITQKMSEWEKTRNWWFFHFILNIFILMNFWLKN